MFYKLDIEYNIFLKYITDKKYNFFLNTNFDCYHDCKFTCVWWLKYKFYLTFFINIQTDVVSFLNENEFTQVYGYKYAS